MAAINTILRHMVDDDRFAGLANNVAEGGFDLQFSAGLEAKIDLVEHRTCDPAAFGDARHGGKAHPGCMANHLQDGRNRFDTANFSNIA